MALDENGMIVWERHYGGAGRNAIIDIQTTANSGCIFAGSTSSFSADVRGLHRFIDEFGNQTTYYWVVKLKKDGRIEWQKCLGGRERDEAYCVMAAPTAATWSQAKADHLTGHHGSGNMSSDIWLTKLGGSGTLQWQRSLGGGWGIGYGMTIAADGGYLIVGSSDSTSGDVTGHHGHFPCSDQWIVKLGAVPAAVAASAASPGIAVYPNPASGRSSSGQRRQGCLTGSATAWAAP